MATHPSPSTRLAFGPFEVNPEADELLKHGTRIRLPGQPFQILLTLLAHPGSVVTREQLRDQLWSEDTFVDFEHGLNAAMNKLRRTLGDSADNPRYIETIPGRGYRFIGVIEHRLTAPDSGIALVTSPLPIGQPTPAQHPRMPPVIPWIFLALVVILAFTWGLIGFLSRPQLKAGRPVLQFAIAAPPGATFAPPISRQPFAISPDGTRLAFTVNDSNGQRIWLRDLADESLRQVPGTEGAWTLWWSPDGHSIFYAVQKNLMQTNLDTGSSRTVANTPIMTMGGTWRSNDDLILYLGTRSYEVNTLTGSQRELPGTSMRWAQYLPESDRFLHVVYDPAQGHYHAYATSLTTGQSTALMETDSRVQYAPPRQSGDPGYLLFIRAGTLLAQQFDATHLQLTGEPFPIAQNIIYYNASASGCFSVSRNGVLVYQSGYPLSELRWYDREGHVLSTSAHPVPFIGTVRISPDGRRVAADIWTANNGGRDIWLFEQDGKETRRLTYPPEHYVRPVWSPDGGRLAFGASRTGPPRLATLNADENSTEQMLLSGTALNQVPGDQIQIPTDWSRDGRFIAYDSSLGEEERSVWLLDLTNSKITPLLQNGSSQWGAAFSPDGTEIAFVSDESGRPEIYLQSFESSPSPHLAGERTQVSRGGAWLVRWRPDGHELFYIGGDSRLYAVRIDHRSATGEPKALFQIPGNPQYGTADDFQFDVTPDGQRFVMTTAATAASPPFTVIQNWQTMMHH